MPINLLLKRALTVGIAGFLLAMPSPLLAASTALGAPTTLGASQTTTPAAPRPSQWAQPVTLDGVPNLHQVSSTLYRSAQPKKRGFRSLVAELGVKTDITLRATHSDEKHVQGLGIEIVAIPMHTWHIEREDVVAALRAIRAAEKRGPVLLHCQHGADRTGLISALYRIVFQGWSKDAAAAEMLQGGFGYHAVWGNIPTFINTVDIAALKKDVEAP